MNHILVPMDGSNMSIRAAELATDLALKFDAQITILHVTRNFPIPDRLRQYMDAEHVRGEQVLDIDEATERVIHDVKNEARRQGVRKVKAVFKEGKPSRSIVEFAKAYRVDTIVMGSRGLTEIEGALLGSVSHKVASLAPCTVIIAR